MARVIGTYLMEVISRSEASALGLRHYYPGVPCTSRKLFVHSTATGLCLCAPCKARRGEPARTKMVHAMHQDGAGCDPQGTS